MYTSKDCKGLGTLIPRTELSIAGADMGPSCDTFCISYIDMARVDSTGWVCLLTTKGTLRLVWRFFLASSAFSIQPRSESIRKPLSTSRACNASSRVENLAKPIICLFLEVCDSDSRISFSEPAVRSFSLARRESADSSGFWAPLVVGCLSIEASNPFAKRNIFANSRSVISSGKPARNRVVISWVGRSLAKVSLRPCKPYDDE